MTAPIQTVDVAPVPGSRTAYQLLRRVFAALLLLVAVLLALPPLLGYPRYEVVGGVLTASPLNGRYRPGRRCGPRPCRA